MKKKSRVPAKPMKSIPEGFEYSEEAVAEFQARAKESNKKLDEMMDKDPGLKDRVDSLVEMAKLCRS